MATPKLEKKPAHLCPQTMTLGGLLPAHHQCHRTSRYCPGCGFLLQDEVRLKILSTISNLLGTPTSLRSFLLPGQYLSLNQSGFPKFEVQNPNC